MTRCHWLFQHFAWKESTGCGRVYNYDQPPGEITPYNFEVSTKDKSRLTKIRHGWPVGKGGWDLPPARSTWSPCSPSQVVCACLLSEWNWRLEQIIWMEQWAEVNIKPLVKWSSLNMYLTQGQWALHCIYMNALNFEPEEEVFHSRALLLRTPPPWSWEISQEGVSPRGSRSAQKK